MRTVELKVTNVFTRNWKSRARYVVNIGGAGSSKSRSIADVLIARLFNIRNRKILITRKTFPALRITAYKLIIDLLEDRGLMSRLEHNKTDHTIINPRNGAFIQFLSIDDSEKIKSTEWSDVWMEEANEFTWSDWVIIYTRLRAPTNPLCPNQIFLSLNPSDEQCWINQRLIVTDVFAKRLEVIHSTYLDNPFLDDVYIEELEGLADFDPEGHKVYAQGLWATLKEKIYEPYTILQQFPDSFDETIYGLDFGFNHPSALIEIGVKDGINCYLRELLYKTHLENNQLIEEIKTLIPESKRDLPIYADSAEPDRISEIYNAGFNIYPADKSVKDGILYLKRKKFYTLADNVNLNTEVQGYRWRKDKNGNVLDEPIKFKDHAMDATRYALYTHFKDEQESADIAVVDW